MSVLEILATNPAVIGLVVGIPATVLAYLSYRRSLKVDKVAEQSGVASQQIGQVGQVITGLNSLTDQLQEDNKNLRADVADLRAQLKELYEQYETLRKELNFLRAKYGGTEAIERTNAS